MAWCGKQPIPSGLLSRAEILFNLSVGALQVKGKAHLGREDRGGGRVERRGDQGGE